MQNPAFWARLGLLWCLFIFAACWCASAKAAPANSSGTTVAHALAAIAAPPKAVVTAIAVTSSQAATSRMVAADGTVAHAIPTLDGFGLFILAALLGAGAFWFWRRRQ